MRFAASLLCGGVEFQNVIFVTYTAAHFYGNLMPGEMCCCVFLCVGHVSSEVSCCLSTVIPSDGRDQYSLYHLLSEVHCDTYIQKHFHITQRILNSTFVDIYCVRLRYTDCFSEYYKSLFSNLAWKSWYICGYILC